MAKEDRNEQERRAAAEAYRAAEYAEKHLAPGVVASLSTIVDERWKQLREFTLAPNQDNYTDRRTLFMQAASLAVITDHKDRVDILLAFVKIHGDYSRISANSINPSLCFFSNAYER